MNKKGFTLIELVMIIVLVGIILPGIMVYFIQGVKDSSYSQRRTTAIFLAEALMEEIKSKRWDEVASVNSTCSNASNCPLDSSNCTDVGSNTRISFNDIDDFNNLNNPVIRDSQNNDLSSKYPGYSQQAFVGYVNAADLTLRVAGPTCFKRIEVRIIDTGANETVKLVSLMTGY